MNEFVKYHKLSSDMHLAFVSGDWNICYIDDTKFYTYADMNYLLTQYHIYIPEFSNGLFSILMDGFGSLRDFINIIPDFPKYFWTVFKRERFLIDGVEVEESKYFKFCNNNDDPFRRANEQVGYNLTLIDSDNPYRYIELVDIDPNKKYPALWYKKSNLNNLDRGRFYPEESLSILQQLCPDTTMHDFISLIERI
jgi:hypothetical protein